MIASFISGFGFFGFSRGVGSTGFSATGTTLGCSCFFCGEATLFTGSGKGGGYTAFLGGTTLLALAVAFLASFFLSVSYLSFFFKVLSTVGRFFISSAASRLSSLGALSEPLELSPSPSFKRSFFSDNSYIRDSVIVGPPTVFFILNKPSSSGGTYID